jgi:hypothetical protein
VAASAATRITVAGGPAFAFSGAANALLPVVEHARIADLFDGITGGCRTRRTSTRPGGGVR